MIYSGLVSITFRKHSLKEIVDLCVECGLSGIEWGGDVHCPHGDTERAKEARILTKDAGLKVAAYGSYYRLGEGGSGNSFDEVLASANALGAPYIRVWAGKGGSDQADEKHWEKIVEDLKAVSRAADRESIGITLEYHENTLTDSIDSADRLLSEAGLSNVYVNWQPTNFQPFEYSIRALDAVLPRLSNLHVFRWNYEGREKVRRPLSEGREDWSKYLATASELNRDRFALLEFVKNDDPEQFKADANVLNELLEEANALTRY